MKHHVAALNEAFAAIGDWVALRLLAGAIAGTLAAFLWAVIAG